LTAPTANRTNRTVALGQRARCWRLAAALATVSFGSLSCHWLENYHAANWDFKHEDYPYAIIRYQKFLEEYRDPTYKREIALINLGRSYMAMQAPRDAEKIFDQYEREFPKGSFLETARESVAKIRRTADSRQKQMASDIASAQKESERIQAELAARPNDADLLVALGHAHWKMGRYKTAGESYLKAIEINPKLRDNPLMLERLIFDINGNLIPITNPQQRVALENERDPVVMEGLHEYTSRGVDDFFSSRRRFYTVTGTVRNRSTRPILGVRIEVTLYDALGQILEVGTADIGTLYPRDSRPFVAQSGLDAEAMGNVARYRCRPLFQQ
jgi:tetratricopeptide (TPR) repeat protein